MIKLLEILEEFWNRIPIKHWIQELWSFFLLFNGRKLKSKKKYPSFKFFFKNLYDGYFENNDIDGIFLLLKRIDKFDSIKISDEYAKDILLNKIKPFYVQICTDLSKGFVDKNKFIEIVNQTLLKNL